MTSNDNCSTENDNHSDCDSFIDELHDIEKYQVSSNSRFFYSNDKFLDTFDDKKFYNELVAAYPQFNLKDINDASNRKVLVEMLNDAKFIDNLLDQYHMNIHDFFVFIYRLYPSMFNGLFVKKL